MGLIRGQPQSGYELRKLLVSTPLSHFSDSPGSIYPALGRMQRKGWIRAAGQPQGSRKRLRFTLTSAGKAALSAWLRAPIGRAHVVWHLDELMLRFAFMSRRRQALVFLTAFQRELEGYLRELRQYFRSAQSTMPITGQLALKSGIGQYHSLQRWAKQSIRSLRGK